MRVDYALADEWTQSRISEAAAFLERLRRDVRDHLPRLPACCSQATVALQLSDLLFDAVDALDPICLLPVDTPSAAYRSSPTATQSLLPGFTSGQGDAS
jgi:hypothetical protein